MSKVIIINGPSCAGKTAIAKAICKQSDNKFVHLQIDKVAEFYGTIFPKGFIFAENEVGTENNDDGLKGLFNNNRLARRKVVASILLATAKELLNQSFNIVIDTALDGPDAKELADIYLKALEGYNVTFVGIYCTLEERLKRLKTRKDNLFLTEDFIRNQTDQYDVFESCKEFYDICFDSSLLTGKEIAENILEHNKNARQDTISQFLVRKSQASDIDSMVLLSKAKRLDYEKAQSLFWRYAGKEGDKAQGKWFTELLEDENYVMLTAVMNCHAPKESDPELDYRMRGNDIVGFIIGKLMPAPEVYNPGGLTLMIDDFCITPKLEARKTPPVGRSFSKGGWQSVGHELIATVKAAAKDKGATQILVVCGAHDIPKRRFLKEQNLSIASEWFVGEIV